MNKEEFLKAIMELSKVETINPISTINSINVDDLMSAIDRLNKVPTYDELLKENKKQKEVIDKAIEYVEEHRIKNPYHYEFNCFMGNARASDLLQILEEKGD